MLSYDQTITSHNTIKSGEFIYFSEWLRCVSAGNA